VREEERAFLRFFKRARMGNGLRKKKGRGIVRPDLILGQPLI